MSSDFLFDQGVAGQYEAQHAHPPEVSQKICQAIAAETGSGTRLLEIGVGTGRIARSVTAANYHITGLDISPYMLHELFQVAKPPNQTRLTILQADMHHLPFPGNLFDAVLAVQVLNFANNWQQVLIEVARVLRQGGIFIQGDDWIDPQSVLARLRHELRMRVMAFWFVTGMRDQSYRGVMACSPQPPSSADSLTKHQFLTNLGGTETKEIVAAEWTTWLSPNRLLEAIAHRLDIESWLLPDAILQPFYQQLKAFAAKTWPNLDENQPVTHRFLLKITQGNWS